MAKGYLSNRQKNLKVGISSYTEDKTVLQVTGKVGIGTTNATQELDVNGDVRIRGGIYDRNNNSGANTYVPVADGSGGWTWQPVTSAGAGTLSGITIKDEGSIVGTSGSITFIDFVGDSVTATASGAGATVTITASNGINVVNDVSTNAVRYVLFDDVTSGVSTNVGVSSTKLVFNPSTGNLGIGTTNPLQNLHVLGNLLVAAGSSTGQHITQKAYELNSGTLSWEGSAGQLFSITNNLTSGSIFSVNDVSGIPSIDVDADGTIELAPFGDGNVGIATTRPTSRLHVVGNALVTGIITASSFSGNASSASYASTAGVSTSVIGGIGSITQLQVTGVSTFTNGPILIGSGTSTGSITQRLQVTGGAYVSGNLGIGTTNPTSRLHVVGDVRVSGASTFVGLVELDSSLRDIYGNVGTAGSILTSTGSGVYWNVPFTIPGSANQVVYKDASNNATGSSNLTFNGTQLNVYDLNVQNNLTIGGTSVYISATELRVQDKEIVLGLTTTLSPTDTTANHGGIAIASTEGSPLVSFAVGTANTLPDTYKQIMWVRSGTYSGLGTDTWMFNYGVGIGSTQIPNGVRLASGAIQFTENDLIFIRNINASGIITSTSFVTVGGSSTQFLKGDGSLDSSTYATESYVGLATSGLLSSSGDGSNLTGVVTSITAGDGISINQPTGNVTITTIPTLGIATESGVVGTGVTLIEFRGPGISTVTVSSGIATINTISGGSATPDISPVMMGMIF